MNDSEFRIPHSAFRIPHSQPLISIVTPSFNQASFLEETLRSVMRQDYPNIEHIVVDGGSTDGSVDVIRRYEKYIACWVSEPDRGQSNAINKGFSRARGTVFAWLNSDDLLAPSAVRVAVEYLQAEPDVGLVYGDRIHIDARGNVVGFSRGPSFSPSMLARNMTLPQETTFFRSRLFQQVGGLDESLEFSMDFDLWCKMAKVARFRHVPAFLGYFREHRDSKSVAFHQRQTAASREFSNEHERIFRRHFSRSLPGTIRARWYRALHHGRLMVERRSKSRRHETKHIRNIVESAHAMTRRVSDEMGKRGASAP